MSRALRIAILGAGAIGCYYGTRLLNAGHKVVFIARGVHLQAIQENGLVMHHPSFDFSGSVEACDIHEYFKRYKPSDFDAVLICVKATATQEIALNIKQWFEDHDHGTIILSLQNGIDNERLLAEALGVEYVFGGLAVRIGGNIIAPGVVEATGVAQVIYGPWPYADSAAGKKYNKQLDRLTDAFNKADIPTRQVDDIRRELWRKLVINNGVNPLSALTQLKTGALTQHEEFAPLVREMMRETALVARADDEELTDKDVEEMFELIRTFDSIKASMLIDREKGRPLELEAISGVILQRAETLGVKVPYTQMVYALLKQAIAND